METSEIIKKVRKIEIKTRGLSQNIFAGQYHSAFKGRGMAFSEVREYQYGDDVRDIDWNVTARFHHPYVKVFEEERELTVMLLVDVSGSLNFGTVHQTKREMVTEIAATMAFSAIQNNDKIGVIFFSDHIEKYIPPKKGRHHILYIIRELLDFKPKSARTDIGMAVSYLTRMMKRRATVFLLSDFYTQEDFSKAVQIANSKHDMIAVPSEIRPRAAISVLTLLNILISDAWSVVIGHCGKASPAKIVQPILSFGLSDINSEATFFAASKRFGFKSSANIDVETSIASIISIPSTCLLPHEVCVCGRAITITMNIKAKHRNTIGKLISFIFQLFGA